MGNRCLYLEEVSCSAHQLALRYRVNTLRFETVYWYDTVDLLALEARYGRQFMRRLYFHMLAFEANKAVSLCPDAVDFSPFADLLTPEFTRIWQTIVHHVWGQWRYENDLPLYAGPCVVNPVAFSETKPVQCDVGDPDILVFCGGGKDSLVAMRLLERAGIPYATFAYASSSYGAAERQHRLIGRLLDYCRPKARHRMWIDDSFWDVPVLELYPEMGVRTRTAAETPASIFAALPVALQHGFQQIVLAHERSANAGNLVWATTGEEINHQWGKSFAAELLLNRYIQKHLIENFSYYSLLQPLYDALIFNLLRRDLPAVPLTHSCNIQKPWCRRCPKCAYVWLNFMAYLPIEPVNAIFSENLFDLPENQTAYKQMLGLAAHTPFECIGMIEEIRLAFELCRRKGLQGRAMNLFCSQFPAYDPQPAIERFLRISTERCNIPAAIRAGVLPQMEQAAAEARAYIAACGASL